MLTFYLVRHGETVFNREGRLQGHIDPPLSELGREQARRIGARLADAGIDHAYASPLQRALESAQIALGSTAPIDTRPGLREMNLGAWEGKQAPELRERFAEEVRLWFEKPSAARIEGAETIRAFRARVVRTMAAIRAAHADGTVAVFAHGGVVCAYLAGVLGLRLDDIWSFRVRNASITRLFFQGGRPRIDLLGDVHHLEGAQSDPLPSVLRMFP
jgi:probable phosphoglycerate mutase